MEVLPAGKPSEPHLRRQPVTPLEAPSLEHRTTGSRRHPRAKTMGARTTPIVGLERPLHRLITFLVEPRSLGVRGVEANTLRGERTCPMMTRRVDPETLSTGQCPQLWSILWIGGG